MRPLARIAGVVAACAPFAFALFRAVETEGRDVRYLWVALAAFAGAMARMSLAVRGGGRRMPPGIVAAGVWFTSTLLAVMVAWLLGTSFGPALFIVGAGFGFCFALSTLLVAPARVS